jgi:peroxiredoxin
MDASGIQDITTDELTSGKKVVIFAVPGAFTPTCSKDHAPGFISKAEELKAKGVDTIACVSVNDVFVMDAWAKNLGAGNSILFLADGNATLTTALDLTLDGSGFGLGTRSQRYAMVVEDGVVTKLEVEPGGGLTCSSADNVLSIL